jgi:predicted phosphodiesterase
MRILIISDVHANLPALQAIDESFDACLCVGDLVEYGPHPREVISWVQQHCQYVVRGNHDHGTAQNVGVFGAGGFRYLTMATRPATTSDATSVNCRHCICLIWGANGSVWFTPRRGIHSMSTSRRTPPHGHRVWPT